MKKCFINEKKGITLIALVITIIVMLILVTVTIRLAVNGKLFDYARLSVTEYDAAKEKEFIEQAKTMAMMGDKDYVVKKTGLVKALDEIIGKDNYTYNVTEEKIEVTYTGSGRTYPIEYNGQVQPEYFYVYKSSDRSVERVQITSEIEENGYDIIAKVSPDKYYGGYFNKYGGTETDVTKLTYVDNMATDLKGEIYDSSNRKSKKNVIFWNKNNAYTEPGNELIPEANKVYYINEIPKTYLAIIIVLDYYPNNNNILRYINAYSVIDYAYHKERSIDIVGEGVNNVDTTTASYSSFNTGTLGSVTIRPESFEGVTGGYVMSKMFFYNSINPNSQFTVTPCWVTYDGIRVDGPTKTYNTGIDENGRCTKDTFHEVTN